MNTRPLFSLLPILCLCLLATSSAKSDNRSLNSSPSSMTDTSTASHYSKSRRLSSPTYYGKKELNRKLKGMNSNNKKNNNQKKDEREDSSPLPSMHNHWRQLEIDIGTNNDDRNSNSHLLRFLKKKKKDQKKRVKKSKAKNAKSKSRKSDDTDDLLE